LEKKNKGEGISTATQTDAALILLISDVRDIITPKVERMIQIKALIRVAPARVRLPPSDDDARPTIDERTTPPPPTEPNTSANAPPSSPPATRKAQKPSASLEKKDKQPPPSSSPRPNNGSLHISIDDSSDDDGDVDDDDDEDDDDYKASDKSNDGSAEEMEMAQKPTPVADEPMKRRRGRPRRVAPKAIPKLEPAQKEEQPDGGAAVQKRGRGRPRKNSGVVKPPPKKKAPRPSPHPGRRRGRRPRAAVDGSITTVSSPELRPAAPIECLEIVSSDEADMDIDLPRGNNEHFNLLDGIDEAVLDQDVEIVDMEPAPDGPSPAAGVDANSPSADDSTTHTKPMSNRHTAAHLDAAGDIHSSAARTAPAADAAALDGELGGHDEADEERGGELIRRESSTKKRDRPDSVEVEGGEEKNLLDHQLQHQRDQDIDAQMRSGVIGGYESDDEDDEVMAIDGAGTNVRLVIFQRSSEKFRVADFI
jgi:hypothetical protein